MKREEMIKKTQERIRNLDLIEKLVEEIENDMKRKKKKKKGNDPASFTTP